MREQASIDQLKRAITADGKNEDLKPGKMKLEWHRKPRKPPTNEPDEED
jgi:hypothetical protein